MKPEMVASLSGHPLFFLLLMCGVICWFISAALSKWGPSRNTTLREHLNLCSGLFHLGTALILSSFLLRILLAPSVSVVNLDVLHYGVPLYLMGR